MTLALAPLTDVREQPYCTCGHRRIHHYRGINGSRHTVYREIPTLCGVLVEDWPCGCDTYQPARLRAVR